MRIQRTSACAHAAFALFALVSTAAAQSTWIVDGANGPGTDFGDLPTAVATAATGDTLVVRPGTYTGFDTDKGLTILGEPQGFLGVRLLTPTGATHTVSVHNLPTGAAFRMAACEIDRPLTGGIFGFAAGIAIENCAGSVLLDDVTTDDFPGDGGGGIYLSGAAQVQVNGCEIYGHPALSDDGGSRCTVVDSLLRGGNGTLGLGQALLYPSSPGVASQTFDGPSSIRLVRTAVTGGNGVTSFLFGVPQFHPGSPAARIGGDLVVAGDASAQLVAGINNVPLAGIDQTNFLQAGIVTLDPSVTVLGSSGGPAVAPAITLTTQHVPWVVASGDGPGGTVDYTLATTANNPVVTLLSLPALPAPTPFGVFELDPLAIAPLFSGSQPAPGVLTQSLAVPNDPALSGRAFAIQAGVFINATNSLELTNSSQFLLYD